MHVFPLFLFVLCLTFSLSLFLSFFLSSFFLSFFLTFFLSFSLITWLGHLFNSNLTVSKLKHSLQECHNTRPGGRNRTCSKDWSRRWGTKRPIAVATFKMCGMEKVSYLPGPNKMCSSKHVLESQTIKMLGFRLIQSSATGIFSSISFPAVLHMFGWAHPLAPFLGLSTLTDVKFQVWGWQVKLMKSQLTTLRKHCALPASARAGHSSSLQRPKYIA